MRAFLALLVARNREFLRDRATLAWNFMFPFVAVAAIGVIFSGSGRDFYKVGIYGAPPAVLAAAAHNGAGPAGDGAHSAAPVAAPAADGLPAAVRAFLHTRHVQFIPVADLAVAQDKVRHHQYDLLLDAQNGTRYWVNPSNPKGYFLERVLWGADNPGHIPRETIEGREIRYIDWLLPGVLSMNIMFSCLWGVGYVVVRYRKGLILRRLKASPINAVQFICSQIASRLILVLFVTAVLYFGLDLLLDFYQAGSLLDLFVVFALGAVCLIALGVLVASRTSNQELAGGLLNLATWPMMFLSGVWFSLEGSPHWLMVLAQALPLTHVIDAARAIVVDGASLAAVWPQLAWLTAMTGAFLFGAALLFRWE